VTKIVPPGARDEDLMRSSFCSNLSRTAGSSTVAKAASRAASQTAWASTPGIIFA
jgi:hypothetical protein